MFPRVPLKYEEEYRGCSLNGLVLAEDAVLSLLSDSPDAHEVVQLDIELRFIRREMEKFYR